MKRLATLAALSLAGFAGCGGESDPFADHTADAHLGVHGFGPTFDRLVAECGETGIEADVCVCLAANFVLGESRATAQERCGS